MGDLALVFAVIAAIPRFSARYADGSRIRFEAVKAWTAYCIASEEIPEERRVDLETTIAAMDLTARKMNSMYMETSEGGLAVSVVLC